MREVAAHAAEASEIGQAGVHQVVLAGDTVEHLQAASRRVENVLELITGVARQTHLLALNATIEAARAGEHGTGFAVVASEVKELAQQTAVATGDVTSTIREIESGSHEAATSMRNVTATISSISSRQESIATAVEEQTATTQAIARTTAEAATQAQALARNVESLTMALRHSAYAGATARTVAAEVARIEESIRGLIQRYDFEEIEEEVVEVAVRDSGVKVTGGTTTVQDYAFGTELFQWDYQGRWGHAGDNLESSGTNSHSSMPGDTATIRFVGSRLRFYGVTAENHGLARLSIDGVDHATIDQYSAARVQGGLAWESPVLPRGEHVFTLTVLGECNPAAKYVWINVDNVQIDA
jgi:hypothetical protein